MINAKSSTALALEALSFGMQAEPLPGRLERHSERKEYLAFERTRRRDNIRLEALDCDTLRAFL